MSFLTDSSTRESLSHTLPDPYDHPPSTGHFEESNPHDYPGLGNSDVGHIALSASSQFDNNSNAIPFSFLYNRSETPLPSLSPSINHNNNHNNNNLSSSFLNNGQQSPFGSSPSSSSSSSSQAIFLPSPTPQLSSTRSPLAVATLPPFQFSPYGTSSSGRSFPPPQPSGPQQMSPQQLQQMQQMQMFAQMHMQMQMQMQMMGQQQQQFNNSNNNNSPGAGQFQPQQMMLQGPNPFGRFTRDASPIHQPLSKSIYESPQASSQPFGQLFRPLNVSQCLLPPGSFPDASLDQRVSQQQQQRSPAQLYSPPSSFPSQRSPTQFNGPISLPPFNLNNPFAYPPPYPVYDAKKSKIRPTGSTEWNDELATDEETGRKILSKSSSRHRKIRPKVVKGKAIQCQGINLKRSSQCRNAALMEYVGPRPCYCAEHIEQDPDSIYAKCKSTYHKVKGDGKGCKEIVMKQFVVCHKHFADHVITFDKEETIQHLDQVNSYLSTLAKEAEKAKKTHLDLYQRKNKLIPKFQRMRAILENRLLVSFPLSSEGGSIGPNENVNQTELTDVSSYALEQPSQSDSLPSTTSPSSSSSSSSSLSSSSSSLLCQMSSGRASTTDQATQDDLQPDRQTHLETETPAAA